MRVLLVTGKIAEPLVRAAAGKIPGKYQTDIFVLPVSVASLASTRFISTHLKRGKISREKYDLVMIPGGCQGSAKIITEEIGIPSVKGPMHATDIPYTFIFINPSKLSTEVAADFVIKRHFEKIASELLSKLEKELDNRDYYKIGDVKVPIRPPPIRIIGEINDAHLLTDEQVVSRANYLVESGADIISIGFEAGVSHVELVYKYVKLLKENVKVPITLDSIIPQEIIAGVKADVDMVMSLTNYNIDRVYKWVKDIPVVLIPVINAKYDIPVRSDNRVKIIFKLIDKARKLGIKFLIVDPILDPPIPGRLFESILAYYKIVKRCMDVPILMGIGNIVELIDADSVGINALLTCLAVDLGISLVLVVEKSDKAVGSVKEVSIASKMASLSWIKQSIPKDLGIDLLILKDKRRLSIPIEKDKINVVIAKDKKREYTLDPEGIFKISVNHKQKYIEVLYMGRRGKLLFRGPTAYSIRDEVLDRKLVSTLSHAFYLGYELGKAEISLNINKSYVQDEPIFKKM